MAGRKKAPFPKLSAKDAHAALRWLHATGVVTAKQIAGALRKRDELVEEIRRRVGEVSSGQIKIGDRLVLIRNGGFGPMRRRVRRFLPVS